VEKVTDALQQRVQVLVIDLLPPGPQDPHGIHSSIWEQLTTAAKNEPAGKPLTLVAYTAGEATAAYVEPVAVGDELPDMPLFLDPDHYVNAALERTYREAYRGVPGFYREILEAK
jgi:hypothetical protein